MHRDRRSILFSFDWIYTKTSLCEKLPPLVLACRDHFLPFGLSRCKVKQVQCEAILPTLHPIFTGRYAGVEFSSAPRSFGVGSVSVMVKVIGGVAPEMDSDSR